MLSMQLIIAGEDDAPELKDPLQKPRPKYDFAAVSGRPVEVVHGAAAPKDAYELPEWTAHMREKGEYSLAHLR